MRRDPRSAANCESEFRSYFFSLFSVFRLKAERDSNEKIMRCKS